MPNRWRWLAAASVTIFGGGMTAGTIIALDRGMTEALVVFGPMIGLFTVAATVLAWRAAFHRSLDSRTRSAWTWIASSFTLLTLATVLYNILPMDSYPWPAVITKLTGTVVLLIGLTRLPMRPLSRSHRLRLFLDAGTVAAAASLFLWYLLLAPVPSEHITVQFIVSAVLHPMLDAGLIFVMSVVLMRGVNSSVQRATRLLVFATLWWIAGETLLTRNDLDSASFGAVGWEFLTLPVAHFLLYAATFEQVRVANAGDDLGSRPRRVVAVSKLPYVAIAAAFVVLTIAAMQKEFRLPWLGLICCTAILTGCVVARQVLAQRENMRMAVTDGLTGLTNRTGLNEALHIALERGARSGKTIAVLLLDLDDFKRINDTLGHEAGDQMLIAFARALRRSVLGSDVVARLGGDEFAVVLNDVGDRDNAEAVVKRLNNELETPVLIGDVPVQINSSIGVALCGPGEMTVDEILHRADMEMYEVKRARKAASSHHRESAHAGR